MKEYQYKVIRMGHVETVYSSEKQLCQLGKEGWKLVSVCPLNDSFSEFLYYFEREKTDDGYPYGKCEECGGTLSRYGNCVDC